MPDFGRWTAGGGDPSLNEINRSDRFFEALAAKQPVYSTDHEEAELAFLLSGWRDDVRDAPITAPVTPRDAVEALHNGLAKNRGPRRAFAVVGSVAAAMLCIGGFGTAVYGAGPGDSLYGMRTSIFGQQEVTRDDQVSQASAQLQQVQQLIDNGQWQEAQDKLVAVSTTVQDVGQVEQKQQLVEQWNALTYKVVEQNPAATLPPGEPLPVLPSSPLTWLPVPVIEATTSESTTTSETTITSETTATSPSDSAAPSENSTTPPSDGAPSVTTSPSVSDPSPGTSAPASSAPPPPPPASSTMPPSGTTITTTTTTIAAVPPQAQATQQSSSAAVELPAPQPRLAPSQPVVPAPASPVPAAPAPVQTTAPATSTVPVTPTTTTVLPPS